MESLMKDLTLDSFLPIERMKEMMPSAHRSYVDAKPFPHVVFDDFLNPDVLDAVLAEFTKPNQIRWQQFDNSREIKLSSAKEPSFGPATRLLFYHLTSMTFLEFISVVTGVQGLI